MARPLRIEFQGAVYHVTSRGNARQMIFRDDADREAFLETVACAAKRYNFICHAYCLMGNHYHLVIETPDGNMSRGMRHINGVYTQYFNRSHRTVGHLFQGRFKAILVEKDTHLLELCRYVVLNPVRAGLASGASGWKWSSYRATAGTAKPRECLSVDWVLSHFGARRREAQVQYREFVSAGKGKEPIWEKLRGQVLLGTEDFVERLKGVLQERERLVEIPRAQRYAGRPSLAALFPPEKMTDKKIRDRAAYTAYVEHGYTMREIAEHLGLHYVTVSRAITQAEKELM
jgi:putative transposase